MSTWDDVKAIPIDEVARRLGMVVPRSGTVRCPFPDHNDHNPSFSFIRKSNACFCHGCGRGGSTIDLVLNCKGCSAAEAVAWLREHFISVGRRTLQQDKLPQKTTSGYQIENVDDRYEPNPALYSQLLLKNPMNGDGVAYLERRGISSKTIASFKIGYIESAQDTLRHLLNSADFNSVYKSGLIVGAKSSPRLVFSSRTLIFPFYEHGTLTYLQTRAIDADARYRWMGLYRITKPIYNTDSIKNTKEIYLCEGCLDVLSANELRRVAIGFTGADTKITVPVLTALRGKTVYIVPDNDAPGERWARRTQVTLRKWGIQTVLQKLPQGKDLNEYLMLKRVRS